uniref:Chorismate synthase n=1 Tax=Lygus hesperus TaxID=30085 RepID=A0A0A9XSW2_LYGHE
MHCGNKDNLSSLSTFPFSPLRNNSRSVNDLSSFAITTAGSSNNNSSIVIGGGGGKEDKFLSRVAKRYTATREIGSPRTREDYKGDNKQASRKGKHGKGMSRHWSSFDNFGDYEY